MANCFIKKRVMKSNILKFLVLFIILLSVTGCYKKEDTIAIVKVVNETGTSIANARVIIYGSGNLGEVTLRDTTLTNSSGEALFNLNETYQSGQAGVAVLDVEVTKDGLTSYGIIKVEQETTSREIVVLN